MATAQHFIDRAMSRVGVKTAEIPLQAADAQTGLDLLNDMLSAWEAVSPMGFLPSNNINDEVRVPRYANAAVIDNLALMIAPEYERIVSPSLAASAMSLKNDMLTALNGSLEVQYPDTLPLGSGNYVPDLNIDRRFFPENSDENF